MDSKESHNSRVTIKDVARSAGVSIATVSYVLNNKPGQTISEETRKKVLQFANILGYECNIMAKYLATGKTNTVAAVVKSLSPFAAQYYFKMFTELSRLLSRRGFDLRLVDYDDGLERSSAADAYITAGLTQEEFAAFADTKYVPVIAVDSEFDDFLFYRIGDNYRNMYETIRRERKAERVTLLTFDLPQEVLDTANAVFDGITVVRGYSDLAKLDPNAEYATVSDILHDCASDTAHVELIGASYALKASAAVDAAEKAINRVVGTLEDHIIKV